MIESLNDCNCKIHSLIYNITEIVVPNIEQYYIKLVYHEKKNRYSD